MRKYHQKAGLLKSINDYCSVQKQENRLTKENLKDLLNKTNSIWESQKELEDNYSVMRINTENYIDTEIEQ
jgi:hypothetical protein